MTPEMNIPNYVQILFGKIHELEEEVVELKEYIQRTPIKSLRAKEPRNNEDKQIFTVQEAAEFLSVSTNTIYKMKDANIIPFMQRFRRIYFERDSLLKWLKEGTKEPQPQEQINQQVVQRYLKPRRKKLGS